MHVLSNSPDVAERLHSEVAAAVAAAGGVDKLMYVDLQRLTYLDAFLKELLRLYPSAGFTREVRGTNSTLHHILQEVVLQHTLTRQGNRRLTGER
jgi:cytochrome P450